MVYVAGWFGLCVCVFCVTHLYTPVSNPELGTPSFPRASGWVVKLGSARNLRLTVLSL